MIEDHNCSDSLHQEDDSELVIEETGFTYRGLIKNGITFTYSTLLLRPKKIKDSSLKISNILGKKNALK